MVGRKMCLLEWWEERESSGGKRYALLAMAGPLKMPVAREPANLLSSPGSTPPGCNLSEHLQNRDARLTLPPRLVRIK